MNDSETAGGRLEWVTFSVREGKSGHHVRRDDLRDEYDGGLPQRWEYFRGEGSEKDAYIYASTKAAERVADGRLAAVIPLGAQRRDLDLPSAVESGERPGGRCQ